jgi:hypothetical protein
MKTFLCAAMLTLVASGQTSLDEMGAAMFQVPVAAAGGGSAPTYVNSGADFTTGATSFTTGWSPANGNTLIVWVQNAAVGDVTSISDSEGTGNTYTKDANISSTDIHGTIFHCANISGSGTYTISVVGSTTPAIVVIEISGNRTLAAVSSGSNPSTSAGSTSPRTPASFTTTASPAILIDCVADDGGANPNNLGQVDGSFTTRQSNVNGAAGFIGAVGTREVASTGTFSDGWTLSSPSKNLAILAAYK